MHSIKYLITMFLVISSFIGVSQFDTTWTKVYGGNREDKAFDIINTQDSGYLIIGSTSSFGFDNSQMYFLKLDSAGTIQWSKSHGGTGQECGNSVIQTRDGGYLGVGYTNSWGAGGFDLLLVKLNSSGHLEYEKYFGGSNWDFANDVIELDSNIFVMAGETQSFGSGGKDGWIVSYDANNQVFDWNKTVGTSNNEKYEALTIDSMGGFYTIGMGVQNNHNDDDVMVSRFNSNGDTIWTKFYGDTLNDYGSDITILANKNVAITGSLSVSQDTTNTLVLSVDSTGSIVFIDKWGRGFRNASGTKVLEMDSNRLGILSDFEIVAGNHDFHFGYTFPYGGYYEQGGTLGSDQMEKSGSGIYFNEHGFIFTGITWGYNSNYSSIVLYQTNKYGRVVTPSTFESLNDTINILDINKTPPQKLELRFDVNHNNLINTSLESTFYFMIYNISGQKVFQSNILPAQGLNLNTVNLNQGIYLVVYGTSEKKYQYNFHIIQ